MALAQEQIIQLIKTTDRPAGVDVMSINYPLIPNPDCMAQVN